MAHSTLISCDATHVLSLDRGWMLTRREPGTTTTPDTLDAQRPTWHPAPVPGTVAAAFPTADPSGWTGIHDLDSADWWYRCTFVTPDASAHARHILILQGVATLADIWLNGAQIARSENMFVAQQIDVTAALRPQGENELAIRCAALHSALAVRRPRPRWRTNLVERQQLRWIRTTLLGRIPGWADSPQPVGPWRPITIETHETVHLNDAAIHPRVDGTDGVVDVTLQCTGIDAQLPTRAVLRVGDNVVPLDITRTANGYTLRGTARIGNVALWWPHTHGAQPQYDATATLTLPNTNETVIALGRIAFRTMTLDTTDGAFTFHVNGVPIFCRGACWSSLDIVKLIAEPSAYREALTLARTGGMNMLRVGGTMVYESDDFYALCDELGILVWQEFMFSNMEYPDDPTFVESVREEARQFLRRVQTRACLALLCGNNEVQQQAAMLGVARTLWNGSLFADVLPATCEAYAPAVPYWSSSPSGGTLPFHVNAGDAHYFGYGPYLRSFDDVRLSGVRFASETLALANVPHPLTVDQIPGGPQGAGHHPVWKRGVPRDNGASWDFEDVRDHYFEQLFEASPANVRRRDPERYLAISRVVSGEVMARTIGVWRRADSSCQGALIWWFRDLRLGAGWGLVDTLGTPKAAYYYFRRAAQPIGVILSDEGLNGVRIDIPNETRDPIHADLRLTLYRDGEVPIADATTTRHLTARSVTTLHGDALFEHFTDSTYAYRFGPPGHDLIVATLTNAETGALLGDAFHFPLGLPAVTDRDPGVEAVATARGDGSYDLTVSAQRFAQAVAIDTEGFRPEDSYFHVPPASHRTTVLRPVQPMGILVGTVAPLNAPHTSRIVVR